MTNSGARVRVALALLLVLGICGCSIPGSEVVDGAGITGVYTVNGVDALDTDYSGTVTITATDQPDRFEIQWIVTGAIHAGIGTLSGDRLDVTWSTVTSPRGDVTGTATYTIDADGNLHGTRKIDGLDGVATEDIFAEA